MDQLYHRYADPFSFMDGMIQTGRFEHFVSEFMKILKEEKDEQTEWEYFLHKVWEGSFNEFKEGIKTNKNNEKMSERTIETTVTNSLNILKNFKPD